jgi:hypothetical protein
LTTSSLADTPSPVLLRLVKAPLAGHPLSPRRQRAKTGFLTRRAAAGQSVHRLREHSLPAYSRTSAWWRTSTPSTRNKTSSAMLVA